ncbi:MAG TPA: glycosyltransferase, partial [Steroidobacteraceae bacterium]|nr:glycosyltransferase [Steroidobacteraceae bacterium]
MDIIVFSDDYNWKGHPSSSMHLANELLKEHRLIWFNVIYRPPTLSMADLRRTVSKLGEMLSSGPEEPPPGLNITVRSPFTIPFFVEPVRTLNRLAFRRTLRELDASLKLDQPVVIATNPFAVDFVRETRPWPAFYYCVDDYSEYPGVSRAAAISLERELLETVDGVAATAMRLLETRRAGKNPLYLPHGVDVEHFASAARGERRDAAPVIGFFGLLSDWVNVDYIARLAQLRPAWTFEMLGRIDTDVTVLSSLPNVKFTKPVPFAQLPAAASSFDVALIPFRINDLTLAVNPLKLLEYFAMGLPVVS